ncbi:MAG: hypothetical protein GXY67_03360 [Clostridiales bacterium]|nr:hypothetical protein [Clostridiales bacterium]
MMQIQSTQEALFIVAEMERRAVQLYERALLLLRDQGREGEPLYAMLLHTCEDERSHLRQFEARYGGLTETVERQLILSAIADGLLFEGGLMQAVRKGMLQDVPGMLRYAAGEEERAAAAYRAFALQCQDEETRGILHAIAAEEDRHLQALRESQET